LYGGEFQFLALNFQIALMKKKRKYVYGGGGMGEDSKATKTLRVGKDRVFVGLKPTGFNGIGKLHLILKESVPCCKWTQQLLLFLKHQHFAKLGSN
jgi:hypothetical protein